MRAVPGGLRVVVTGSESTGKTTLAARLAVRFGAPWSPEFARLYVDRVARPLGPDDVEPIARGQIASQEALMRPREALVIHDTDLLSTVVYARHYYGACPPWIEREALERRGDLYLLCHPDVPWVADGLQRDRAGERDLLHRLFRDTLVEFAVTALDVRGDWDERTAAALLAVERRMRVEAPGRGEGAARP